MWISCSRQPCLAFTKRSNYNCSSPQGDPRTMSFRYYPSFGEASKYSYISSWRCLWNDFITCLEESSLGLWSPLQGSSTFLELILVGGLRSVSLPSVRIILISLCLQSGPVKLKFREGPYPLILREADFSLVPQSGLRLDPCRFIVSFYSWDALVLPSSWTPS